MSMKYVNTAYGTAFKRGMFVVYTSLNAKPVIYRVLSATYQIHAKGSDGYYAYFHPRDLLPVVMCQDCAATGQSFYGDPGGKCAMCQGRGYHVLTWAQYRDVQKGQTIAAEAAEGDE